MNHSLTDAEFLIGILLAIAIIGGSLYGVSKLFVYKTQDILVRFILLIFTAMVSLYVVDKVVARNYEFLPEEQNAQLFDLIKTLVLMIFSYYFGTRENSKNDGENK
jgi:hypothetical protein